MNDKQINLIVKITDKFTSTLSKFEHESEKVEKDSDKASSAADKLEKALNKTSLGAKMGADGVHEFAGELSGMLGPIGSVLGKLSLLTAALTLVKKGFDAAMELGKESLSLAGIQNSSERLLGSVMATMGGSRADYQGILDKAAELQGKTAYGDEAYIAGAAELSTYITDPEAIKKMMGTLSNYAAGMSGGAGEVNTEQMTEYATQLGKALNGAYDGLAKKGFSLTDAQKEIIDNGEDMEKALVLDEIINESWANLAENMAALPENKIQSFNNQIGDMKEMVGNNLAPAVGGFYDMLGSHMGTFETLYRWFSKIASGAVQVFTAVLDPILDVVDEVVGGVGMIFSALQPIIAKVVGLFADVYATVYNVCLYPLMAAFATVVNFIGNLFNDPVAAIEVAFDDMAIAVLNTIKGLVDGAIALINLIPGVEIGVDNGVDTALNSYVSAVQDHRAGVIADSAYKEWVKAPELKDTASITKAAEDFINNWSNDIIPDNFGTSGNPVTVEGGGAGGSLKVNMADEDVQYLRDLAQRDYVAKIAQNTLAPNLTVTFGDVHETADVNELHKALGEILRGEIETAAAGAY